VPPPRLYLVTDRHATGGRPLVDVVAAAVAGAGAAAKHLAVQLREKDLGGRALLALARELLTITRPAGARLFLNGRVDVAAAAGVDGVHLGGGSLSIADVRAIAPSLSVAVSTHDAGQLRGAAGADFVVFGPVFDTPSKRGLVAATGTPALSQACAGPVPVLALGGIDETNARECLRAGAAGVACIRAVMGAADPSAATAKLLSCFAV
jgi:thiamine-phosphate pyrophosphorylase